MNVLFINMAWDAAGCSILQTKAINKHTNWKARHFRAVPTFGYETDITPANYNRDEFADILAHTDVIEWCSADHKYQSKHNFGLDLWDYAKDRINIFHDYNSFLGHWKERATVKDVWNRKGDLGYAAIFSSIPQATRIYKDCIYIPDVVDELSPQYTPDENRDFSGAILGHYPTGGGNNKNTEELMKAIEGLNIKTDIAFPPIAHPDLLKKKKKINLAFDALWRGFHGMTTVENLALGIPTICGIDDDFYGPFRDFFNVDEMPIFTAQNTQEIKAIVSQMNEMPSLLKENARRTRNFALEHWSFKNVANRIVREYEKL